MELVSFAKEMLQDVAEHAASYRIGQSMLRQMDRVLWVVEKCARWAVPPPLDQDERPQPELIRPLPWAFFLVMLVTLRVTRESISLINLIMGKPPLRSADVVMYIQSKRRYLRTLKYTGNRAMRARTISTQPPQNWYSKIQSLFEVTMCFRGRQSNYGNNNTSTNNEELLVVKRSKRSRDSSSPVAATSETSMERLIEKMMIDLDAESDDDSSFTLTNPTSPRSDRSDTAESDQDTVYHNDTSSGNSNKTITPPKLNKDTSLKMDRITESSPKMDGNGELSPKKEENDLSLKKEENEISPKKDENEFSPKKEENEFSPKKEESLDFSQNTEVASSTPEKVSISENNVKESQEDKALPPPEEQLFSPKKGSQMFIQNEKCSPPRNKTSPKNEKIANGRPMNAHKKRGSPNERRDADAFVTKKVD